jgi:hypothetical protein
MELEEINKNIQRDFKINEKKVEEHLKKVTSINDICSNSRQLGLQSSNAPLINTNLSRNYIKNYRKTNDYSTLRTSYNFEGMAQKDPLINEKPE